MLRNGKAYYLSPNETLSLSLRSNYGTIIELHPGRSWALFSKDTTTILKKTEPVDVYFCYIAAGEELLASMQKEDQLKKVYCKIIR